MDQGSAATATALITARLDRLPMTRHMWMLVALVSFGAFFELYDLLFTGYIAPGLFREGIFTATTQSFFGMTGLAGFLASLFVGLFLGTILVSFLADRFGRQAVFTYSLLWYSATTVILAFQATPAALNFWRLIGGIGIGVEMVTVDAYVSELMPKRARGQAFCLLYGLGQIAAPALALLAWILVPMAPLGLAGWRWIILGGSVGAAIVWWVRRSLPESPRWLAQQGRLDEAEHVLDRIEAQVEAELRAPLPKPDMLAAEEPGAGRYMEIFGPAYRVRTIMMMIANFAQTIAFFGFVSWIPTLLIAKGIRFTESLEYTFLIVIAYPLSPLLIMLVADKFERKWQLVGSGVAVAAIGLIFSTLTASAWLIIVGFLQTLSLTWMSTMIHAYQSELFPTRIRARAVGFVFSWSRFSSIFTGFFIAFFLHNFGVVGVFLFISGAMAILIGVIIALGPRTSRLALEEVAR